jgi:hypothetical protein
MTTPAFNPSTMQELAERIAEFVGEVIAEITAFVDAANDLLGSWALRFLGAVRDAIRWIVDQIVDIAQWIWEKVKEANAAVAAPLTFWFLGGGWADHVEGPASDVAASISPAALRAPLDWTGDAANRYKAAVAGQGPAAAGVSSMGGTVGYHLRVAAVGGATFYAAMVAVVVKFISVMTAATAATATGVGAPPGLAAAAGEAASDAAVIGAAIVAVVAVVGSQATAIANIEQAANQRGAFPNQDWPVGTA